MRRTTNAQPVLNHFILAAFTALFVLIGAAPAYAACTGAEEGRILYNGAQKLMQYCDGTDWIAMNKPGTGTGGCTNPAVPEGSVVFNSTYRVNMLCAGSTYQAMGPYNDPNAAAVAVTNPFVQLRSDVGTVCGIRLDGSAQCWGSDSGGRLGNG
jgi:hypothetical protein